MTFAVYLPPQAEDGPVPVLWYLSGLTCTHENAMTKAGAQGWAAEEGIAVIFPDTSPRGEGIADDTGLRPRAGRGFYVNATEAPWAPHFRMWDYVVRELPDLVFAELPLDRGRQGITGHSMGGHGALTIAMSEPGAPTGRCRRSRRSPTRRGRTGGASSSRPTSGRTRPPGRRTTRRC